MKLNGARVLITGASSGIGAATAIRLHGLGARLLLTGRDETALRELARRTGAETRPANLADPVSVAELAEWAGAVDVLVANAGLGWAGALPDMPLATIDELIEVNLTAHLRLTRLLLPGMLARGAGHLAFVSSIAGCLGVADEAVYAASKAALRTFAGSLRLALAPNGIGVSAIMPGVVATPFFTRRGRPYARARPKPIPAETLAAALVNAVAHNRAEVFRPRWLRLPARLHGAAPTLVQAMQRRFG